MSQRILFESEGGLAVLIPAKNTGLSLAEIAAKDIPSGVDFEIVPAAAIPQDRTFRGAWRKGAGRVDVDMPAARTIHMNRIRAARDLELARLDVEYVKADESGNSANKAAIAQQKQALRDIPQTFDLTTATSPAELSALWPAEVPR